MGIYNPEKLLTEEKFSEAKKVKNVETKKSAPEVLAFIPFNPEEAEKKETKKKKVVQRKESRMEKPEWTDEGFKFPENGWVCGQCLNYNFHGRQSCFRCKKIKTLEDIEGLPKHLKIPGKVHARPTCGDGFGQGF